MADASTIGGTDTDAPWAPKLSDGSSLKQKQAPPAPGVNYDNLSSVLGLNKVKGDLAADRVDLDRREANAAAPKLSPPPPQAPATDPFQAFGQPAMWLAAFGSLLSRNHLTTAIQSAGGVVQATHNLDLANAKQNYDQWKVASENAIKSAKFEQDAYKAAISRYRADSAAGEAEIKTLASAFKNAALETVYAQEGMPGVVKYLKKGSGDAASLSERQALLDEHLLKLQAQAAMQQSWDAANPHANEQQKAAAKLKIAGGKDPDEDKGASANWAPFTDPQTGFNGFTKIVGGKPVYMDLEGNPVSAPTGVSKVGTAHPKTLSQLDSQYVQEQMARGIPEPIARQSLKPPDPGAELSPAGKAYAVRVYRATGSLPPGWTQAAAKIKTQIINEAGQQALEGGGGDLGDISGRATTKADTASLANITKVSDSISAYAKSAEREFNLAKAAIPKTAEPLDSQFLTKWVREGATAFGDTSVPKYMTYLISGLDEYAKIIGGATGAAASSDSSRDLALSLLPKGATTAQIPVIIDAIQDGIRAKREEYDSEREAIQHRLRSGVGQPKQTGDSDGQAETPPVPNARKALDNNWYVPDVTRPGKYMRVVPGG